MKQTKMLLNALRLFMIIELIMRILCIAESLRVDSQFCLNKYDYGGDAYVKLFKPISDKPPNSDWFVSQVFRKEKEAPYLRLEQKIGQTNGSINTCNNSLGEFVSYIIRKLIKRIFWIVIEQIVRMLSKITSISISLKRKRRGFIFSLKLNIILSK